MASAAGDQPLRPNFVSPQAYRQVRSTPTDPNRATFFFRTGLALLPDILSVLLTQTLLPKQHFYPIYALTQALVLFCLYPSIFTINLIIVYSDETGHPYIDTWQRLCWSEMGLQAVLMVMWTALVIYACIAVHKWRGVKAKEVLKGVVREEMEMQAGKGEGRKDSANVEEGRDALVCESVKSDRVFL